MLTAASGVVHEEIHEKEFAEKGGVMEMVQLWVNLPKAHKMSPPRYQGIVDSQIPVVASNNASVQVIAGKYHDKIGPAKTFTPINLYDVRVNTGQRVEFNLTDGYTTAIFLLIWESIHGSAKCLQASVHAHRIVSRDRHHRDLDCPAGPGGAKGPRSRGTHAMHQQPQEHRAGDPRHP